MDFLDDLKSKGKEAVDTASDAYNAVEGSLSEGKKSFARALVDATNLQPADMRNQPWAKLQQDELKDQAAEFADVAGPNLIDAVPLGGIVRVGENVAKMVEKAPKILQEMKGAGKTISKLEDIGLSAAKLAEAKSANLPELTRKGAEYLDKPYFQEVLKPSYGKTVVKESAKPGLGKVIVKETEPIKPWMPRRLETAR